MKEVLQQFIIYLLLHCTQLQDGKYKLNSVKGNRLLPVKQIIRLNQRIITSYYILPFGLITYVDIKHHILCQ